MSCCFKPNLSPNQSKRDADHQIQSHTRPTFTDNSLSPALETSRFPGEDADSAQSKASQTKIQVQFRTQFYNAQPEKPGPDFKIRLKAS